LWVARAASKRRRLGCVFLGRRSLAFRARVHRGLPQYCGCRRTLALGCLCAADAQRAAFSRLVLSASRRLVRSFLWARFSLAQKLAASAQQASLPSSRCARLRPRDRRSPLRQVAELVRFALRLPQLVTRSLSSARTQRWRRRSSFEVLWTRWFWPRAKCGPLIGSLRLAPAAQDTAGAAQRLRRAAGGYPTLLARRTCRCAQRQLSFGELRST